MNTKILILVVISLIGMVAQAQQIAPVYTESKAGKKSFHGQFAVINQGIASMPVIVEPRQLQAVDGKPSFGALLPGTTVVLKDTSAVVSPKSSRTFDYEVHCEKDCVVTFLAGMTTGRTKEGVQIRLWLMSSAFLCSNTAKDCRVRTKKAMGLE
jgi:hypothetical protein